MDNLQKIYNANYLEQRPLLFVLFRYCLDSAAMLSVQGLLLLWHPPKDRSGNHTDDDFDDDARSTSCEVKFAFQVEVLTIKIIY
jgi:hypothetical protein